MKAVYFFIINRISFSGTTLSGGYSQLAFDTRFTDSSIDRLQAFCKILKPKLRITNYDYKKVIDKDGKNVFIYLDPPYAIENEGLYGKNGDMHKNFDHEKFAEDMKNCKHKWLITYNDCEYIRNLFSFARIVPFEAKYGMKNVNPNKVNQKGNEILIMNY
jgi:DNA adenine methylase